LGPRFFSATSLAAEQGAEASKQAESFEVTDVPDADARRANKTGSPPSNALFVTNIPFSITPADLVKKFDVFGDIMDVRLAMDRNGRARGFGHIEFVNREDAEAAFESALREPFCMLGREMRVDFARNDAKVAPKVPNNKLHFAGFNGNESDIRAVFGDHDKNIKDVYFLTNKDTGEFTGNGFIEFATVDEATAALLAARRGVVKLNYARPRTTSQQEAFQEKGRSRRNPRSKQDRSKRYE
jgi:nucleolin